MASRNEKTLHEILLDFQTRLQGVGNSLAVEIQKVIEQTDQAVLKTIIDDLPSSTASVKEQMQALEGLVSKIEAVRKAGFAKAEKIAFAAGPEIVKKAGATAGKLADNRGQILKKELPKKKVDEILDYHPVDGKSISQWFHAMQTKDLERITQAVQRATVEGLSASNAIKAIRGTKENDYKDGVLEASKQSAAMTARTIVNGIAANAMLETCAENAEVIDGVKFLATLDAKTCPFCGAYDGTVWKPNELDKVKRPPLHPNCRCVVIPYVDVKGLEGQRPAANADFDRLAEEAYNKTAREKGWERRYADLSRSTRLRYYYDAQKRFEKETGKPAYSRVSGDLTFKDYFEKQPEEFKRSWLGPKRYELYSRGGYDPLQLANPDSGYLVPLEKLAPDQEGRKPIEVPQRKRQDDEEYLASLQVIQRLGGSTAPVLAKDARGKKFVVKKGGKAGGDPQGHVRNEFAADQFYRAAGVKVPGSRLYETKDGPVLLSEYLDDGKELSQWWREASDEDRDEMLYRLRRGLAADILIGNSDVIGQGADNILVDKNGVPWRIDNGGSLGYTSKGQRKADADWKDGYPDDLWTMTGRGGEIGRSETNKLTDYLQDLSILDVANAIDAQNWDAAIKALPPEDQEIVRKRLEHVKKLAARGNDFTGSGHSRDYSEQILDHSYNLTKQRLQDILPDKIDETDTSTFAGFRTGTTAFDGTFKKIAEAAKTVNLSHNARLTDYYQPPLEECYKLKPALEEKAKNGDKAAKYYLDKIKEIEECVQSRKNVTNILSPEETGFDVGREGPFYEVMENYVNSAREGEGKYQRIVEWAGSQGWDSYHEHACDYKMVVLHSMGCDVTDPKKSVSQIVDELSDRGYYVGEPRSSSLPGGVSHRKSIEEAIQRARSDPDSFKELCGTLVRYQAGVVLALEKTDFRGNDKSTRSVILMRTENGDIPGIKGKAIGEVCTHKPGIAESFSQHTTICVQGSELTMVRVPYSRINGFWFTHRKKGSPMFYGDRENEFNVNANGLAAYLVEHDVSDSSSVEQFMPVFEKAEKEHKKKPTK